MKTLIILHGWQSSKEKWQRVKEEIESADIKVAVPDIPGFKPATKLSKPWTLNDYLNWLKALTDNSSLIDIREEFSDIFLLGHSFGGRLAIKFAATYPEKLRGLILVSAAGVKREKNIFNLTFLAVAKFVQSVLKLLGFKKFEPFLRKMFYSYILRKTDYLKLSGHLRETMKNVLAEDITPLLEKISLPTLIVWGKKDKITPLKDAYLMKQKIQNSQLEILEKIGHSPHLENHQLLCQKVKSFLNTGLRSPTFCGRRKCGAD